MPRFLKTAAVLMPTDKKTNALNLTTLAAYAAHILEHHLDEYISLQHKIGIEINLPLMLAFIEMPEQELHRISAKHAVDFLTSLSENNASAYIEKSIQNWQQNQLPMIDKYTVAAEDITKVSYIRKQVLLHFLPGFTTDVTQAIQIVEEIDKFLMQYELAASHTYVSLLEERLATHHHFIEHINHTIPGALYIFSLRDFKNLYVNDKIATIIGYSQEELNQLGQESIKELLYEDDTAVFIKHLESCRQAKDGEILSYKYRVRQKDGRYKWIRNFESIFKRNVDGEPEELIAIALDIDQEKRTAEQLKHNQNLYSHAERLSNFGSWQWNAETGDLAWTDQLYTIYGLAPQSETISLERFLNFVHPHDRATISKEIESGFPNDYADYTFRIVSADGQVKHIRSIAQVSRNSNGKVLNVIGTEQDITERQLLLEKLQENEALYQQAQSIARLGNWSWDITTNTVQWSSELYRIFGLDPSEDISFEKYVSLLHPDDKETAVNTIETSLQKLKPYDFYHRILVNDTPKIIHSRGEVLQKDGVAYRVVGTGQDVTEWKRLIDKFEESERLYKQAQALSHIGNWSVDLQTNAVTWSDEMFRIYELPPTEQFSIEKWTKEIVHPDDREALRKNYEECLRTGQPIDYKHRIILPNGNIKTLHRRGEFVLDHEGKLVKLHGTTQDITEEQNFNKKIQEQEYFIQHIADASPTILYLFDVATNSFAYVNQEVFYVLGYTPDEMLAMDGEATLALYHPDDLHLLPERHQGKARFHYQESMMQYECRMRHKSGDWCWVLVREVVFKKDDNGNVEKVLGAALDINKRKEMERTLIHNAFQLEQSNSSLEEFAYVASHDLKEPLRKISTFGDRLAATQMDRINDDGKIYLKKVIDASQRMQTMIDDLLSVSMITGNQKFEPHSLQAILDDARQAVEFKLEQKGAIINATSLPEARIVASQFRQLFQNLLSNSLKFVREDVQPVITITHSQATQQELTQLNLFKATHYLKLEFKDNGIGFENEFAGKIFQIFQRLHGRSEYEGTGIGLAICKKIVEHHGGVIYASGIPGEGATFTILLPQ